MKTLPLMNMEKIEINSERRNFFKKAGLSAISVGLMGLLPFKLFANSKDGSKNPQSNANTNVNIIINPMAVKREKRK
jgi:hypothetical protein